MRSSMQTNVLLQRPKVGKSAPSTRDLPPDDFAYGPQFHDNHGVKEMFEGWSELERPSTTSRVISARYKARQDYPATNRAAVHAGCVSPHEFRDFKQTHNIPVRPPQNHKAEEEAYRRDAIRSMTHGIPTPVSTEMNACMTWQGGHDAVERGRSKQTTRHSAPVRRGLGPVRMTRASRAHTAMPPPAPTEADTFKMRRFREIDRYAIDDQW
jgi:hypothetical protein